MTDRGYGCQGLFQLGTLQGKLLLGYVVYNEKLEWIYPRFVLLLQFTSAARECSISSIRPAVHVGTPKSDDSRRVKRKNPPEGLKAE
jgi:hypothetical protein